MKPTLPAFIFCLLLTGCGDDKLEQAQNQLKVAQQDGQLSAQKAALLILINQNPAQAKKWQSLLDEVIEAEQLNQQAKALLLSAPFEALPLAAKADQIRFNHQSRQLIVDVIKPYVDFLEIFKPLREWAYPSIQRVVTPNLLAPGMDKWQSAAERPTLWPENNLTELIAGQYTNTKNLFYGLASEYKQFYEMFVVTKRMTNKSPEDDKLQSLHNDASIINQMYNTALSDLLWYYCKQSLTNAINIDKTLLEIAKKALSSPKAELDWRSDHYYQRIDNQADAYRFLTKKKQLLEFFSFVDSPSQYDSALRALATNIDTLVDENFEQKKTPKEQIEHLNHQLTKLTAIIAQIETLSAAINRADITAKYLYITYSWQSNNLYELELLVPYLKHYKHTIYQYP